MGNKIAREKNNFLGLDRLAYIIILLGSIVWSLTTVKSGILYDYGVGFWGPHAHDGVWHIALANSLSVGTLEMPTFSGENIKNYHIGYDLLLAFISRITNISVVTLYFQIIPPIISILIGYFTYKLIKNLWGPKEAVWSVFFVYFSSSFGFLVSFLKNGSLGGESLFWSQQSISTLLNPPYAMSLVLILLGLLSLVNLSKGKKIGWAGIVLGFGFLMQIKAYGGLLIIASLLILSLYKLVFSRKYLFLYVFFVVFALNVLVFLPLNKGSESLVSVSLFWFPHTMLAVSDRFYWPKLYEAITNWRADDNWAKYLAGTFVSIAIFFLGNIGVRMFSFFEVVRINVRKIHEIEIIILSCIFLGLGATLIFVQEGTPWNIIQFMYYALFFLSIYLGKFVSGVVMKAEGNIKYLLAFMMVFASLVPSIHTVYAHYLPNRPPAKLSVLEVEALTFLSKIDRGVVLVMPFDKQKAKDSEANPPRPLALYESTAYVSAFSKQPVYMENEVNLTIMNFAWKERREKIEEFMVTLDQEGARKFLKDNNIKYLYWRDGERAALGETQLGIELIFENKEVKIYER